MKNPLPAARTVESPLIQAAACGLLLLAAALAGCDPTDPMPPRPQTGAAPVTQPSPPPAFDSSLPDARSALSKPSAEGSGTPPSGTTSPTELTPQQESSQMPLPGQANNYSPPDNAQRVAPRDGAASAAEAASPAPR